MLRPSAAAMHSLTFEQLALYVTDLLVEQSIMTPKQKQGASPFWQNHNIELTSSRQSASYSYSAY